MRARTPKRCPHAHDTNLNVNSFTPARPHHRHRHLPTIHYYPHPPHGSHIYHIHPNVDFCRRLGRATLAGLDIPSEKAGGTATQRWGLWEFRCIRQGSGGSSSGVASTIMWHMAIFSPRKIGFVAIPWPGPNFPVPYRCHIRYGIGCGI